MTGILYQFESTKWGHHANCAILTYTSACTKYNRPVTCEKYVGANPEVKSGTVKISDKILLLVIKISESSTFYPIKTYEVPVYWYLLKHKAYQEKVCLFVVFKVVTLDDFNIRSVLSND